MADSTVGSISGTSDPYKKFQGTVNNEKGTLQISDYFSLLAAQLANQDMTNPMDNSEMMGQMVQMAMMQAISSMTDSMNNSSAIATQTYAAGLVGQEVTIVQTEKNSYDQDVAVGVKYGKVISVNLANTPPTVMIEGDSKEYPLDRIMGMGHLDDPFAEKDDENAEGPGGSEGPDGGDSGENGGSEGPGKA